MPRRIPETVLVEPFGHVASCKRVLVGTGEMAGLTYGNGSIWVLDYWDETIYEINPITYAMISSVGVGTAVKRGMCWDSILNTIWIGLYINRLIRQINPATGATISEFSTGGTNNDRPIGVACDGEFLWVTTYGHEIRKYSKAGVLQGFYYAPWYWEIWGLFYATPYLYGISFGSGDSDNYLIEFDPATGEVKRAHTIPSGLLWSAPLAFDGEHILTGTFEDYPEKSHICKIYK